MPHASDSLEQREAEALILEEVSRRIECRLEPRRVQFPSGAIADVNGVSLDESVFVEVSAHQGPPKGGQRHKIAADLLKLVTLARGREPRPRLILAFADQQAAAWSLGKSWLAASVAAWEVEVMVVNLEDSVRQALRAAQARQVMSTGLMRQPPQSVLKSSSPHRSYSERVCTVYILGMRSVSSAALDDR
jgi:hypothetical protein